MTVVEALARHIAARLGLPLEDIAAPVAVFYGTMPDAPTRAVCVIASGLRPPGEEGGSGVQVLIRADPDAGWALTLVAKLTALLDEARDIFPAPDAPYIHRVETLRGFELSGVDAQATQLYSGEFIAYCA